jgi:hypothetical protein
MYIRVILYCGHLIILWLFHLGRSCIVFVVICTVVVLYCFVMCVYVFVCVCGCLVICILYCDWGFSYPKVFPCFFLSCKSNARVKIAKIGHGPHSFKLVVIWVVRLLFVLFCVLFVCKCVLPPGDNPTAVNKYIILDWSSLKNNELVSFETSVNIWRLTWR